MHFFLPLLQFYKKKSINPQTFAQFILLTVVQLVSYFITIKCSSVIAIKMHFINATLARPTGKKGIERAVVARDGKRKEDWQNRQS